MVLSTISQKIQDVLSPNKSIPSLFPEGEEETSNIVLGIDSDKRKLILHPGPENVFIVGADCAGKSNNTAIPTNISWKDSAFFYDIKGKQFTTGAFYRKHVLGQKVICFNPCSKESAAFHWNPLDEIALRTDSEYTDVSTIAEAIIYADRNNLNERHYDPFWDNCAIHLLIGVILHCKYKYNTCTLADIYNIFAAAADDAASFDRFCEEMVTYSHIEPDDFLSPYNNPLKNIYGEYITDFDEFQTSEEYPVHNLREIRKALEVQLTEQGSIDWSKDTTSHPWYKLLVHPRIRAIALNYLPNSEIIKKEICRIALISLSLYVHTDLRDNLNNSDFSVSDLFSPGKKTSIYFVTQPKDNLICRPVAKLFVTIMLAKGMSPARKADNNQEWPKVLMLFYRYLAYLGYSEIFAGSLPVCNDYGITMCLIEEQLKSIEKVYGKVEAITNYCPVQVLFPLPIHFGGEDEYFERAIRQAWLAYIANKNLAPEESKELVNYAKETAPASSIMIIKEGLLPKWRVPFRYFHFSEFTSKMERSVSVEELKS